MTEKTVIIPVTDASVPIKVKRGEEVIISLESNPTTGFDWAIKEGPSRIGWIKRKSHIQVSKAMGSECLTAFTIKTDLAGTDTVTFVYTRPWVEGNSQSSRSFTIIVE